jgi:hypothetical protein
MTCGVLASRLLARTPLTPVGGSVLCVTVDEEMVPRPSENRECTSFGPFIHEIPYAKRMAKSMSAAPYLRVQLADVS